MTGKPRRPQVVPAGPHPAGQRPPAWAVPARHRRFGRAKPGAPVGAARIPADPPPRRRPARRRGDHRDRPVAAGGGAGVRRHSGCPPWRRSRWPWAGC